jgi:hypothetical protein
MSTKKPTSYVTTVWSINTICIIETNTATTAFQRNIAICKGCEDSLFGGDGVKYRIRIADEPYGIHERICQVILAKLTS